MLAGTARSVAIGDTAGGSLGAGSTAGVLTVAAVAGATVAVGVATCAVTRVVAGALSVFTEVAGRATSGFVSAGDGGCAAEPVPAVDAEPRSPAGLAPLWAAAVGIGEAMGADVAAVEVLARKSALVAFAVGSPELRADREGSAWVP